MTHEKLKGWCEKPDEECVGVCYERNVKDEDKIPGLAAYVEAESSKVLEYLAKIGEKHLEINKSVFKQFRLPEIILSDEKPTDTYGHIDSKDALEQIREICWRYIPLNHKEFTLPVSITAVIESGIQIPQKIKLICRMIEAVERNCELYGWQNDFIEEVKNVIVDVLIENQRITGEYSYKVREEYRNDRNDLRPEIRIYYLNFDKRLGEDKYCAQIAHTLAHEIMHAFHDYYAREFFRSSVDKRREVIEAVADFSANMYCLQDDESIAIQKRDVAKKRYNAWCDNFGTSWPYYNAIYFMKRDHGILDYTDDVRYYEGSGCFEKMKWILFKNQSNPYKSGYDVLIS